MLREEGTPVWKDTFLVRSDGDTQVIRTRYRRFTGTFVLHCHILDHEDQGMMELVRVMASPPAIGAAGSGCAPCEKRQRLLPLRRGR